MATQTPPTPEESKFPKGVWLRQWMLATQDCGVPMRTPHSSTLRQVPERVRRSGHAPGVGWRQWSLSWHSVAGTAFCRRMVEALCWHYNCTRRASFPKPEQGCLRDIHQVEPTWVLREDSCSGKLRCGCSAPGTTVSTTPILCVSSTSVYGPAMHKVSHTHPDWLSTHHRGMSSAVATSLRHAGPAHTLT